MQQLQRGVRAWHHRSGSSSSVASGTSSGLMTCTCGRRRAQQRAAPSARACPPSAADQPSPDRSGSVTARQRSRAARASTAARAAFRPASAAAQQLQEAAQGAAGGGANGKPLAMSVRALTFHPPGAPAPLLQDINMQVPRNSLGLIYGRSGSGKTTLLQVLAGLCEQTAGSVHIHPSTGPAPPLAPLKPPSAPPSAAAPKQGAKFAARMAAENRPVRPPSPSAPGTSSSAAPPANGNGNGSRAAAPLPPAASMEQRMARVGLVFQFPERHFLGSDVFSELTFTWPRDPAAFLQQQALRARVIQVLQAVRLADIDMSQAPWSLSGGQQRRLALAIQLIRQPSVLLLDEPLAGLDWQARLEVVELLQQLKQQCSLLVVSHDLREVSPLVDCAWTMKTGGVMEALPSWPPPEGLEALTMPPGSYARQQR